ncbi:molybdopterin-dependent oxidoreductase [Sulfuricurvum sp.]|uniref:molybdopterin-dependent oxidoreductase n=1 Tax=Sulfuricurvum sp. TaxID=2025608 RepID=UPI00261112D6|nr:molybdopterin-dependent oxidoreductase [Sulfuricurvum sp.]MDD2779920.1 molybdopterin-dependent oxidoreductase [Sulfuricurvum sp.]
MMLTTACPLDCYDACRIVIDEHTKLKGDKTHPVTRGYLCPNLNHFHEQKRLITPRLNGEIVTMDEALEALIGAMKSGKSNSILYYRGSGNVGLLQRSTEHFFASINAVGTSGSLCDSAGEAGILRGRGSNEIITPQMLKSTETVIFWGRNPHTTHSHLLPFLEGKNIIVIDPIQTEMAKKADLHIQIKPHCDLHLALLLSRFAIIEGLQDEEFLEAHASEYNSFYELSQTLRIKTTLEAIDVSLGQIGAVLDLIRGKKCVIFVGVGVQKYRNGADILHAIDSFAAIMGLFGKEGCGVSYLGDSLKGIELPFKKIAHRVSKATVDFSKYNCVFVQGGNPLSQMPATTRVKASFENAGFKVYFGLYENETSLASDLVIPAKTFLEKNDFRSSYGDYTFQEMPRLVECEIGISEYDLALSLCEAFGEVLVSEETCRAKLREQMEISEGVGYRLNAPKIPYETGFENGVFEFSDELDLEIDKSEGFHLITSKHPKGLNSQFYQAKGVYMHPEAGFEEGITVELTSKSGSVDMLVYHDRRLRNDCVLIYSGTPDANVITPALLSYEGEGAVYQETKIKVTKK